MFKKKVCFKFGCQLLVLVVLLHLTSGVGNSGDSDNAAVGESYGAPNSNNADTRIVEEPPGISEFNYNDSNNTVETGLRGNVLNETATRNRSAALEIENEEILDEEYDYDYDDAIVTLYWPELGPTLFVFGATLVIGIIGNSLIIFTICRYRRMKSTTNVFLASLASADLLLIIICTPVKVAKLFSYTWAMGPFLCKSVHYLQNVSAICSVLTLTAMSIERYYAIVHPMKAKYMCTISQARKIVLGIWIASFLLAVPNLITQEHITVGDVSRRIGYLCVLDQVTELWRFHEVYMLLLILVIPTCIMVVAYGSISWEIWHVMQRRYDMTSGQALNGRGGVESFPLRYSKRQHNTTAAATTGSFRESLKKVNSIRTEEETNTVKQVIKMLVAVVVLFIICWAPLLILNVMFAYGYYPIDRATPAKYARSAFTVMAYSNSCINPLVYGFMSKNFRESFYKALCRCCYRGSRVPNRHFSISQTRTTSVRFGRTVSVSTAPN